MHYPVLIKTDFEYKKVDLPTASVMSENCKMFNFCIVFTFQNYSVGRQLFMIAIFTFVFINLINRNLDIFKLRTSFANVFIFKIFLRHVLCTVKLPQILEIK